MHFQEKKYILKNNHYHTLKQSYCHVNHNKFQHALKQSSEQIILPFNLLYIFFSTCHFKLLLILFLCLKIIQNSKKIEVSPCVSICYFCLSTSFNMIIQHLVFFVICQLLFVTLCLINNLHLKVQHYMLKIFLVFSVLD